MNAAERKSDLSDFQRFKIELARPMEIIKFRSQLVAALEPVRANLRRAQHTVARVRGSLADRSRALQHDAQKLLAGSLDVLVVAKTKIIKFRALLVAVLERVKANLRRTQHTVTRLGGSLADRSRALQHDARKLLAGSLDVLVVAKTKIIKFRALPVAVLERVRANLRRAQHTVTRLGRSVADRPRALQQALRARENDVRKLLASSLDAVVITDVGGRLITANSKALDLLGVSEANMKKFTINVFLSHTQIPYFGGHSSAFIRREERHGECRVRRLDGSLRVAEYLFVPNVLPNRHVCSFRSVTTARLKCVATFSSGRGIDSKPVQRRLESRSVGI